LTFAFDAFAFVAFGLLNRVAIMFVLRFLDLAHLPFTVSDYMITVFDLWELFQLAASSEHKKCDRQEHYQVHHHIVSFEGKHRCLNLLHLKLASWIMLLLIFRIRRLHLVLAFLCSSYCVCL
jgi:hypothetical protein